MFSKGCTILLQTFSECFNIYYKTDPKRNIENLYKGTTNRWIKFKCDWKSITVLILYTVVYHMVSFVVELTLFRICVPICEPLQNRLQPVASVFIQWRRKVVNQLKMCIGNWKCILRVQEEESYVQNNA